MKKITLLHVSMTCLKKIVVVVLMSPSFTDVFSQGFPWERPLRSAWSSDGITFGASVIFQDSSGVPSVIRWKGDTLICAFQWFRVPMGSPTWDKVAVKFSFDNGLTWTQPSPIVVNGLPVNYQRPFDPALLALNSDSVRIYFSSSDGMPNGGLDSTVNTYSAISTDGINYSFEPGARVDEISNRVIDPSIVFFHNAFHYVSPIGSPQQGAYHYVSPDGLNFMKVQNIPSDSNHNWTGNYMVNDTNDLRFYGAGRNGVWFNATPNGGVWNGYTGTNIGGGDPGVVKTGSSSYLMVFVGNTYTTGIEPAEESPGNFCIFPNPAMERITVTGQFTREGTPVRIYTAGGSEVMTLLYKPPGLETDIRFLPSGIYFISIGNSVKKLLVLTNN
jgi:hypothetical protein